MILSCTRKRWILILGDVALILLTAQISPWIRFGRTINTFDIYTGASTFTVLLYLVMLYIFDLYNTWRSYPFREIALRIGVAVGVAALFSAFIFYSLPNWKYGRGIFFIQMIMVGMFLAVWRWLFYLIFQVNGQKEDVLILGAGLCGRTLCHLLDRTDSPYRVVGFLDDDPTKQGKVMGSPTVLGTTDQLTQIAHLEGIKTAILAITHDRPPELICRLRNMRLRGMNILDMPSVYEKLTGRLPIQHIRDEWLIFAPGFYLLSKEYVQKVKRVIEFGTSGLLLVLSLPLVALTALAIRLESRGAIFFRQTRVGKGGSVFTLWKFRSMYEDAEQNGPMWAGKRDCRVTRVGKWLRLIRIDELPQIWNVFRGEMSLIGPRPERPEFVQKLEAKVPYYSIRHSVRPGITGWAQVNYSYGASVEDAIQKLEYDMYYIKNMSLLLDLKILLRTIGVVFFGQGAR